MECLDKNADGPGREGGAGPSGGGLVGLLGSELARLFYAKQSPISRRNESGASLFHHPLPATESGSRGLVDPAPKLVGMHFEIGRAPDKPLLGTSVVRHGAGGPGQCIARLGQLVQCPRPVLSGTCGYACRVGSFDLVDRIGKRRIGSDEAEPAGSFPFPNGANCQGPPPRPLPPSPRGP